jgi:hypothetical protein
VPEHVLLVTEPSVLAALEQDVAAFWRPFLSAGASPPASTAELASDAYFRSLVALVRDDIRRAEGRDPRAGIGMRNAHRLIDPEWLSSPKTRFELIGVVNRIDRRHFAPEHCGETRLVYRLAYRTRVSEQAVESRLPMTLNVVFWQRREPDTTDCVAAAQRWPLVGTSELATALRAGPLAPERMSLTELKSIELDYQRVRWPSTVRPSMAGHAEYVLRVLHAARGRLEPGLLENTPDVERLRREAGLRTELLAFLKTPESLAAIEAGTARLPERFLARQAVSISPHGLGRLANRPFRTLFAPDDFASADLSAMSVATTPGALLRRLDGMSCQGCHQSRSTAGFHLLGEERDARKIDALEVAISPHLAGDLPRRSRELRAALGDTSAAPEPRELSDHELVPGGYGAHCGLGDRGLARFACAAGLTCMQSGDPEMGSCLPDRPGAGGDPCELAAVRPDPSAYRDSAEIEYSACGPGAFCFTNEGGFPNGMCAGACDSKHPDTACGLVPILGPFNECVAGGTPFPDCIRQTADPAAMHACDAEHACRDDYVCARGQGERGVCLPTYFLFQLRVDGHDRI